MPKPHKIHYDRKKYSKANPRMISRANTGAPADVVVKWVNPGSFIEDGYSHSRSPGDEDVMGPTMAKKMQVCGLVRIVGSANEVFKGRTLTTGVIKNILDGREE